MRVNLLSFATVFVLGLSACDTSPQVNVSPTSAFAKTANESTQLHQRPEGWDAYWYAGLAEVNSYEVSQERYGEQREASEVLIFVTEPFLLEGQVKDDGISTRDESISVFKLNRVEKFTTGIYDYSIMTSVFTPVSFDQYPYTLKTTFSAQDWCGHVWQQLNRRSDKYALEVRSYFQSEGDERKSLAVDYLEDELVSRVRIDPASVPQGKIKLVPSAKFLRLRHVATQAEDAVLGFSESEENETLELSITYPKLDRQVNYTFEIGFPHKLLGWREVYKGATLSTGSLKHSRQEAYWSQNSSLFDGLRDTLGI